MNKKIDPLIQTLIQEEIKRENDHLELIASENYTSEAVMAVTGSLFTNKYAEGYPHRRYYRGCDVIDKGEQLAIDRIKELFNCHCSRSDCKQANTHANVQPHSGSQANAAAYYSVLEPGDKFLAMKLNDGGHLTHGHKVNFSGRFYSPIHYPVDKKTKAIDYQALRALALEHKPKLIVCGASAYSLKIDFAKIRKIADEVSALVMADIAHIAGLIVAGLHPNPVCDVDIITSTTHKTLRGPRGGVILCTEALKTKIDKAVFPANQGGPLEHVILAKAQAFYEASQPEFITYQKQIIKNAQAMVARFQDLGYHVVANATDNHLLMINVKTSPCCLTGKQAVERLASINIIANKNVIPYDDESPFITSGVRFGTPAMTTRGFKEKEFCLVTDFIVEALNANSEQFQQKKAQLIAKVQKLLNKYTIYQ